VQWAATVLNSRTATGTLLDIQIGGRDTAPTALEVQNASDKIFGKSSGAEAMPRAYPSDYVTAAECQAKIDAFWGRTSRLSDDARRGAGAGDRRRLGDLDRIAREIRDVAARRDREKAGVAAEFGPKLERYAQRQVKPAQAVTEQPAEAAREPILGFHGSPNEFERPSLELAGCQR
jgi:hypothetical protein